MRLCARINTLVIQFTLFVSTIQCTYILLVYLSLSPLTLSLFLSLSTCLFIYLSFYTYIHLPTKPAGAIVQPLGIVGPQKYKTKVAAQHPPLFIHLSINSFIYPSMLAVGKWFAGLVSVYIIMLDRHCLDISLVFIERWLRPPPTLHLLLLLVLHPPRL